VFEGIVQESVSQSEQREGRAYEDAEQSEVLGGNDV